MNGKLKLALKLKLEGQFQPAIEAESLQALQNKANGRGICNVRGLCSAGTAVSRPASTAVDNGRAQVT